MSILDPLCAHGDDLFVRCALSVLRFMTASQQSSAQARYIQILHQERRRLQALGRWSSCREQVRAAFPSFVATPCLVFGETALAVSFVLVNRRVLSHLFLERKRGSDVSLLVKKRLLYLFLVRSLRGLPRICKVARQYRLLACSPFFLYWPPQTIWPVKTYLIQK